MTRSELEADLARKAAMVDARAAAILDALTALTPDADAPDDDRADAMIASEFACLEVAAVVMAAAGGLVQCGATRHRLVRAAREAMEEEARAMAGEN